MTESTRRTLIVTAAILAGLALAGYIAVRSVLDSFEQTAPNATSSATAEPRASLRLLSSSLHVDGDHATVVGEVENIGPATLDHISAVITWRDESGAFVMNEQSILDVSPIPPGGRSTWDVITRTTPQMKFYTISFSRGQTVIPHVDAGK